MAKLHISPEAQRDLQEIKEYITVELASPKAALNTVGKITKGMRSLESSPGIGAPLSSIVDYPTDYRFIVSGNYLTFYRQEERNIFIVRVLYGKRDYMKILFRKQDWYHSLDESE